MGPNGHLVIPPLNPCGSWKLVSWKVSGQGQGLQESLSIGGQWESTGIVSPANLQDPVAYSSISLFS